MSAEQLISSVDSPWGDIGRDAEEKLVGAKRSRALEKRKRRREEGLGDFASVGARDLAKASSRPRPETKVSGVEAPTSFEPTLNNTSGDVESEKKMEGRGPVGSAVSRRRRNPELGTGRILPQEERKESSSVLAVSEEVPEVKGEEAKETRDGVSEPEASEVPSGTSEDVEERDDRNDVVAPGNADILSEDQKGSLPHEGYFGSPEYKETMDDQSPGVPIVPRGEIDWKKVQKDFDEEGKKVGEERAQSVKFNRLDAQESFDKETEQLKNRDKLAERFRDIKSFDELLVLLNDPEFPGIQGSRQFYSGDDLRRVVAVAQETGVTDFATSSHGFRDAVERLLRQDREGKAGVLKEKENDIADASKAAGEVAPEIVLEEPTESKPNALVLSEGKERRGEEEKVLEGEYPPEGEESLQELRERISALKHSADEARNRFLTLRHRNTSKWIAIKKALFSSRPKEPPEPMVNELDVLKSDWMYKLTLYKDAVVDLAKREAVRRKLDGKAQGALMAEAIRGLELQGSIENYDAWKSASWGDRKDSGFLRALGRARDWAEQYRKLDWKKRMVISAAVVGTGIAGVAVGSTGFVGLGIAGSTIVRLLGAYGAGRGSYEFLEGRAARKTLQYHEAALSNVEKIEDIGFLEQRMKSYADRTQDNLNRAIAGNRRRVMASMALGSVLFLGGTAFAHRGAIQEFSGKISSGFSRFVEQAKIISGLEDFHAAPVSSAVESGGFASDAVGSGMINHGQAAEIAEKIGKSFSETATVPKGSSFEGALIERLTESGVPKEEAGKLAHRAMLDLAEKTGKPFEFFNHIRPGAEIQYEIGSDGSLQVFGVTRKAGGEVIKQMMEPVSGETPSPVSAEKIVPVSSSVETIVSTGRVVSPPELESLDAFDKYKGAAIASAAAGGGALAWSKIAKMRERRKARQEGMRENEIEDTRKKNSEFEATQKRANEVIDQVLSIVSFPNDRKELLREIRNRYGVYSDTHPSEEAFRDTMGKIAGVLFGSEAVLQDEDILGNMFLAVAQRGIGDPENKNLAEMRTGIKNGYSVFQVLFGKTGERLPAGKITGLSVRDVLRLFTERFLTGKMPEELRGSNG